MPVGPLSLFLRIAAPRQAHLNREGHFTMHRDSTSEPGSAQYPSHCRGMSNEPRSIISKTMH